jgi:hypothetical protein
MLGRARFALFIGGRRREDELVAVAILAGPWSMEVMAQAGARRRGAADLTIIKRGATARGRRSQRRRRDGSVTGGTGRWRRSPWRAEDKFGGGEGSRGSTVTGRSLWTWLGGEEVEEQTNPRGSIARARWLQLERVQTQKSTRSPSGMARKGRERLPIYV